MTLQLTLLRCYSSTSLDSIQGELYLNGVFFCHTIERFSKAIPNGCFSVGISYSPRFHKQLPYISVKGRSGIRIHAGNTSKDSTGCVLVGRLSQPYLIIDSRVTLSILMSSLKNEKVTLIVK
jgi:hypothetical protein